MKPLKIEISAFGPYADKQVIDFTLLESRNFFLIHGPTGSGKTSVLDAICFALYGETSGGERETKNIRSDYSYLSESTEVTFDFLIGKRKFSIHRSPEQERPKKRGEGTTKQLSKAALWEIKEEEKTVIADRWSKVTEAVKSLLGFEVDQFRQVVILPQGQFRKLLQATSSERQIILETLFQTGIYREIEEVLKEAARKIKTEAEELLKRKSFILEQADVENSDELGTKLTDYKEQIKAASSDITIRRTEEKKARERLEAAQKVLEILKEKEDSFLKLEKLKTLSGNIELKKITYNRGLSAEKLKDAYSNLLKRRDEKKELSDQIKIAETALKNITIEKNSAEERYTLEKENTKKTDELKRYYEKLKDLKKQVSDLEDAENKLKLSEKNRKDHINNLDRQKKEITDINQTIEIKKADLEKKSESGLKIESLTLQLEKLKTIYNKTSQYIELKKKGFESEGVYKQQQAKVDSCESDFNKLKRQLETLENEWITGQAAILSLKLKKNNPCPVCGSKDHPSPASSTEIVVDEKALKSKRIAVQKQEKTVVSEKEERDKLKDHYNTFKHQAEIIAEDLENGSEEALTDLKAKLKETEKLLNRSEKDKALTEQLDKDIIGFENKHKKLTLLLTEAEETGLTLEHEKESNRAVFNERNKNIPKNLKTIAAVDTEITQTERSIHKYEKNYLAAEKSFNGLIQKEVAALESVKSKKELIGKVTATLGQTEADFNKRQSEEGFESYNDFKEAQINGNNLHHLEKEITDYKNTLVSAEDRFKRADISAKECKTPDIESIKNALKDISADIEEKQKTQNSFIFLENQLRDLKNKLNEVIKTSGSLDKEYQLTGLISDVANGKNAHGMTFQRYVLASLLEDVLFAAGKHLTFMSRGRFDLIRSKQRTDMRTSGGLDLLVTDAYTGTTRPVNTLSGGESFLASLSLALGLADIVQSYSGGIRLDTIFIDEGFGSLDPETLDLAFKAFADLQNTGRLIGIISHVPELKERIQTRLEVVPGKRGSIAKFVL